MILTDARARTHTRMSTCFRNVAAQGDFGGWVISTYNIHIIVFLFFFFFLVNCDLKQNENEPDIPKNAQGDLVTNEEFCFI